MELLFLIWYSASFFIAILSLIPIWLFVVPLIFWAIICIGFWKRKVIRYVSIVMCICTVIPFVTIQGLVRSAGEKSFESMCDNAINTNKITKYRFRLAGLEDSKQYWKLDKIDKNDCEPIIQKYKLEKLDRGTLSSVGSLMNAPWWWPKSPADYLIYEGDDGSYGSIEIWIAKKNSSVYLYKFTE